MKNSINTLTFIGTLALSSAASAVATIPITPFAPNTAISASAMNTNFNNITTFLGPLLACTSSQILGFSATGVPACVTPGVGGTVTSVVAGTGLTGGTITTSGTINVDVGTSANKIVQLDGSGHLPAVNASNLTNLNPANLASAIPLSKGGTGLTGGGAAYKYLGMDSAGSGLEYKSVTASSPLAYNHSGGTSTLYLNLTANRLYTSDGSGNLATFSCAVGQTLSFNVSNEPLCTNIVDSSKLPLSGGTMTGALNLGAYRITNLGAPTASTDAATKGYVDGVATPSVWTVTGSDIYFNTGKVGIGTSTPQAVLDLQGTTGMLVPRMATNPTGAEGMVFFDNNLKKLKFYDGFSWRNVKFDPVRFLSTSLSANLPITCGSQERAPAVIASENLGGAYNTSSNIFTAPDAGVYEFAVEVFPTSIVNGAQPVFQIIVNNGTPKGLKKFHKLAAADQVELVLDCSGSPGAGFTIQSGDFIYGIKKF